MDLAETVEGDLFDRLALDPILLCNTLAAICRPEMQQHGVTDEDFAEGLAGDVIDQAAAALIDAIVYFFRLRHGGIVAKIATKKTEVEKMALGCRRPLYRLRRDRAEGARALGGETWAAIWRCAGVVGLDPWPYTLRELDAMASARDEAQWDRAASIIAAVVTAAGTEACDPCAVHPYYERIDGKAGPGGDTEIAAEDLPAGMVFGLLKSTFIEGAARKWPIPAPSKPGAAYVELFLKDGLTKGLKAASARLKAWGGAMQSIGTRIAAVGGLVTAPILAAVQSFVATGDKLNDMATRTGVAVEALSGLAHAAEMSGTDLDVLEKGLIGMAKGLFSAEQGSKKLNKLLTQYGVSLGNIESLSPEEQFLALADVVARSKIRPPARRWRCNFSASRAKNCFRCSPVAGRDRRLAGGSGHVRAHDEHRGCPGRRRDGRRLESAEIGSGRRPQRGRRGLGADVLAGRRDAQRVGTATLSLYQDHRELIVTLFKVVVAATAIGTGLAAVGTAIVGVGAVLGGMAAIASTVGAAFGAIVSAIGAVLSPIGLVTAAVVGLAGYFAWSSGAIGQTVDWLKQQFTDLAGWVKDVWAGIRDALAAGDLALAGRIAIGAAQGGLGRRRQHLNQCVDRFQDYRRRNLARRDVPHRRLRDEGVGRLENRIRRDCLRAQDSVGRLRRQRGRQVGRGSAGDR